jgi:hypothetical protein
MKETRSFKIDSRTDRQIFLFSEGTTLDYIQNPNQIPSTAMIWWCLNHLIERQGRIQGRALIRDYYWMVIVGIEGVWDHNKYEDDQIIIIIISPVSVW